MDSTLLLFDYITEVQQSKVESNFHDIKDICDELERGLNAFYNSEIVMEYYNKYGATEHFEMLIGSEELIDTLKGALASFIRWVKRKLIQLSSFLFQLIKSVVDVIASLVWMVFHVKEYTVGIDCPYNLRDLITAFYSVFVESRKNTNYRILDDQSIITAVQSKLSELYTELKNSVVKAKTVVKYNRSEFKKRSIEFETLLNNAYTTEIDTLAHCIESFSKIFLSKSALFNNLFNIIGRMKSNPSVKFNIFTHNACSPPLYLQFLHLMQSHQYYMDHTALPFHSTAV